MQEILASAGSQWRCLDIGVIYGQLEVHGYKLSCDFGLPDACK